MGFSRAWKVALVFAAVNGAPARATEPVSFSGIAFYSTGWSVKVAALPAGVSAASVQEKLQDILDQVNASLSTYQNDSELMRFNRSPVGQWQPVSPTLLGAVHYAQQVSALSGGAFDATVAPLVNLWGFGPAPRRHSLPSRHAIAMAKARVGWRHLLVDEKNAALQRQTDIQVDLSSLGEGAGTDAMAAYLESLGIHDYMASVAGTFRVSGHRPDGHDWQIAIEKPDASGQPLRRLHVHDQVVSSAGLYRNYFTVHGHRYAHIIDPATGWPVRHHGLAVTVVEPSGSEARLADATATAFNVLGPEKGLALAEQQHLAVYFLVETPSGVQEKYTAEFAPYLEAGEQSVGVVQSGAATDNPAGIAALRQAQGERK